MDNIYKCDEEEEYSINTLREDGSLAVRLSVKVMVEGSFGAAQLNTDGTSGMVWKVGSDVSCVKGEWGLCVSSI